jgi:hypothetical protein
MQRFEAFVDEGNYPKALEELEWAKRALNKAHHARIDALFPERLGIREGQPMERSQMLGLDTHSRRYAGADDEIVVVLSEGASGNVGFAAIEQLSRLFGVHVNSEAVRIEGRGGTLVPADENAHAVLTLKLEAGATLQFRSPGGDTDALLEAARAFGVETLDEYLSGDNPELRTTL